MAKSWEDIPGWFNFLDLYAEQVQRAKDGDTFVELGAWQGRSTCAMGQLIKDSGKRIEFYSVEHGEGSPELMVELWALETSGKRLRDVLHDNVRECGLLHDYVRLIYMDSALAAHLFHDGSVAFVFHDANHSTEILDRDIRAWLPKMKRGGIMAGHDAEQDSVAAAVRRHFPHAEIRGSCWLQVVE